MASNKEKELIKRVYEDLNYSSENFHKLHEQIKDDFKFAQGDQADPVDVEELKKAGVKYIIINKIKPIIKLITGIERQSRSDYKAFPEGEEDSIVSDIASRLMKNVTKMSRAELKHSEMFKHGAIGGLSFIEPYMDYTYDLINGVMRFHKVSALDVFPDPDATEYDYSDAKFMIKVTRNLSADQLKEMYPDKEKVIDSMGSGSIDWESIQNITTVIENDEDYKPHHGIEYSDKKGSFDLIEYFYKELTRTYYVVIQESGQIQEVPEKDKADEVAQQVGGIVISKMIPVMRHAHVVGGKVLDDGVAWYYPRWKKFHLIPFFAEFITEEIGDKSKNIQGIVRAIKDLQEEFNKRRTQELRHLNSSANSGFDIEKGQLDDQNLAKLKKYGSSAGIVVERKPGSPPLARIVPMPLSQGHAQLAEENMQDLKEASGVNPDLLATDSKSQSGRAILLKQRQGLVMIQEMLDNFGETKKLTGQFILSQLKEIFTVESAMKVLGEAWVSDNFTVPVNIILQRGLGKMNSGEQPTELEQRVMLTYPMQDEAQPIVDEQGNLKTEVDQDTAIQLVNNVLNDAEIGKYDVAIGEGPYSETIRMANFLDIKELAQQGVPIPPDVLIELSMIPEGDKKKIMRSLAAQAQAMQRAQGGSPDDV